MVCQKSVMHEKLPPHASDTATCPQPASLSLSQWAKLQSEPRVLCSARQGDLSCEDRQKADLAQGHCHAPHTNSMGHWAEGIRHGRIKRKITHAHKYTHTHTHRPAVSETMADWSKKTEPKGTNLLPLGPVPSKGTLGNLQEKTITSHRAQNLQVLVGQENSHCTYELYETTADYITATPSAPLTLSSDVETTTGPHFTNPHPCFSYFMNWYVIISLVKVRWTFIKGIVQRKKKIHSLATQH